MAVSTKVLIPSGALGIRIVPEVLEQGLALSPDIIAIDGGSTDSGPFYLGTGTCKYSRASVKREWRLLMQARAKIGVPLLIGTAGTCGTDSMVDWMLDITRECAAELGQSLKVATLRSDQVPGDLAQAFKAGSITPLEGAPEVCVEEFTELTNAVALAGAEQIQAALETGADVVIAGRATDTAVISALPLARGCHPGAAWHGAKVGECGALATDNPASGAIFIEFDASGFTAYSPSPSVRATPETISAHMLYENADPLILHEPGGHLDVTGARYTALDERTVRVEGSAWVPSERYTLKLEGARLAGYQTVSLTLVRDPRYVALVSEWCEGIRRAFLASEAESVEGAFDIEFRFIGQDATLGALEPRPNSAAEIGVLTIVTAQSQAVARDVAKLLNPYLLHAALTENEPMPTFAFAFSPPEMDRGALYEFALHHVITADDPMALFTLDVVEVSP